MTTYTFSEARQKLSSVLEQAKDHGEVLIKRKDGSLFVVKPVSSKRSPLDVSGVNINLKADEIVDIIREVRER
ncbi:MAG: type II toxin-antitoxin system Phd/YefM family antitoxin [Nitrospira sp.]|nr:type II toxin-antitoxin system Phd/YefM family antitoxin [bacterium]MBL7048645.1 type II toxin-antitoxin system Phd/YefM family antitoxin [Nitrospira sp.]